MPHLLDSGHMRFLKLLPEMLYMAASYLLLGFGRDKTSCHQSILYISEIDLRCPTLPGFSPILLTRLMSPAEFHHYKQNGTSKIELGQEAKESVNSMSR
jgi:hypothetical protein